MPGTRGRIGWGEKCGSSYKKTTQEILVLIKPFVLLNVMVDTKNYTDDKIVANSIHRQ